MMKSQHPGLRADGRFQKLSLMEQLAHIGSEVERTMRWKEKNNQQYADMAFIRALELLDLTILGYNKLSRLKELTRLRELLVDYFQGTNQYASSDTLWHNYFYPFTYAARIHVSKSQIYLNNAK